MHDLPTAARPKPWLLEAAVIAAFTAAGLIEGWSRRSDWGPAALLLVTVPLAGRRRWPLACFAAQLVGVGLVGPPANAPLAIMLAVAVGGYAAVGVSGRRPRVVAAAGAAGGVTLMHFSAGTGPSVLLLLSAWLLVCAVRSLWQRSQTAQQYAQALQREHRTQQALAVETERARIARELHDVLGHNVSVMMIQAGAARQAVQGQPEVCQALQEVESAGRQAMSELRHLLALLDPDKADGDPDDDPADLSPQPGLAHLEPLLERVRAAGLPVSLNTHGPARPLEPGVDLAAYRVIQEGLTNALKYAAGAPTEVTVWYEPVGLSVAVRDHPAATPSTREGRDARDGSGRGLLGLRERVALYDGHLQAGRQADGGYQLRAHFPVEAA